MTTITLAEQCARAVLETVPQVMRAIRDEMRQQGPPLLSLPQLRTLAYLHCRPGSCLFRLAEHLGVTRPTASSIVERLVRRGMVTRAADPEERRRVVLGLTPMGASHLQRARQSTQAWMATALSRLSPSSLRRIKNGVALLEGPFGGAASGDGRQPQAGASPPLQGAPHPVGHQAAGRGGRDRTVRAISNREKANGHGRPVESRQ